MLKTEHHYVNGSRFQQKIPVDIFLMKESITDLHTLQTEKMSVVGNLSTGSSDPKQEHPQETIQGRHVQ